MYKNIGKKIMVLAQVCGWVCLIGGALAGLYYLLNSRSGDDYIGWICLAVAVIGLVSSWPLFGFGQMVDDVNAMRRSAEKPAEVAPSEELSGLQGGQNG